MGRAASETLFVRLENADAVFADSAVSIDARRLYRLGLFGPAPATLFVECQVMSAETPVLEVRIVWDPKASRVRIGAPGRNTSQAQTIAVGRREDPRGGGYYFVDPADGARREKLYYVGGSWGSRGVKKLRYASRSGSLGDRYRHALRRLTALLETPDKRPAAELQRVEARIAELEGRLAALPTRRLARAKAAPRNFSDLVNVSDVRPGRAMPRSAATALGSEAAIARGQALDDPGDELGWLARRSEAMRALVDAPPVGWVQRIAALSPDYSQDHPRLSLRVFQAKGLLRQGGRRSAQLDWTGLGCGIERCNLVFDLRDENDGFAALEIFAEGEVLDQALRVVVDATGDVRFVCPLSGVLAETLAYRAGAFAAPAALRLTRKPGRA